jgi:hypothetical protein
MYRLRTRSTLAVALLAAACSSNPGPTGAPSIAPSVGPTSDASPATTPNGVPASATKSDAKFTITVDIPASQVTETTAITPVATFGYVGSEPSVVVYHGLPLVVWSIRQVDGRRTMSGGVDDVCTSSPLTGGEVATQEFQKGGEINDDPTIGFDVTWFQQRQLKLPAGHWAITATFDGYLGDCGAEHHVLSATVEVEVLR